MNVGQLREFLSNFADKVEVGFEDPNFGGVLPEDLGSVTKESFRFHEGQVLIAVPCIESLS